MRYRKGADMYAVKRGSIKICVIDGCSNDHVGKGYCAKHLWRFHNNVPMDAHHNIRRDNIPLGTRRIENGYVMIKTTYDTNGWEFEHRLVMGEYIGRKLFKHETVHHKNGIKR